jgi:hypothetical protein
MSQTFSTSAMIETQNKIVENEENNDTYVETPFSIINLYYKEDPLKRLVRHQLESYNKFVSEQIIKTIEMFKENNPGEPLPEHMQDDFNICDAFCAICKEILELQNKV